MLSKTRSRSRTGKRKQKTANAEERKHLARVKMLPCVVCNLPPPSTAHHCFTGIGRRKDHYRCISLCWEHHIHGPNAIDGKIISKRQWEQRFGTEEELLKKVNLLLKT